MSLKDGNSTDIASFQDELRAKTLDAVLLGYTECLDTGWLNDITRGAYVVVLREICKYDSYELFLGDREKIREFLRDIRYPDYKERLEEYIFPEVSSSFLFVLFLF